MIGHSIMEKIKNKIKDVPLNSFIRNDTIYLIYKNLLIYCYENSNVINISFHIYTTPTTASLFILNLLNVIDIKNIEIVEIHSWDENGNLLTGDECYEKEKIKTRKEIEKEITLSELQYKYLTSAQIGKIC